MGELSFNGTGGLALRGQAANRAPAWRKDAAGLGGILRLHKDTSGQITGNRQTFVVTETPEFSPCPHTA